MIRISYEISERLKSSPWRQLFLAGWHLDEDAKQRYALCVQKVERVQKKFLLREPHVREASKRSELKALCEKYNGVIEETRDSFLLLKKHATLSGWVIVRSSLKEIDLSEKDLKEMDARQKELCLKASEKIYKLRELEIDIRALAPDAKEEGFFLSEELSLI